uniref:C3H1-type domain-containing protein n=1 Tax=Panagrolaimus davidi TaxID=227884 RepID=A0A914P9I1_9BILA
MLQSTPHSNGFPLMTYFPQQFQQQIYQQQKSQFQFQQSMIPFPFNPMNNFGNYQNFMNSPQHYHQQQQFQRKCHNQFQLPRPTALCYPPSFATTSAFNRSSLMMSKKNLQQPSNSENKSATKEETPREIFFKTLSSSLKEANKFYSGKTTSWKNPFLYKTHLCENFCNRQYCRFGVNCWYAHGPHELRCIPDVSFHL